MAYLPVILIIGALTTFTDLKSKKIYNAHLIIGAVLGIAVAAHAALFRHEDVLYHIMNGTAAFIVGLLLHRSALWRGGDAKLFTLYSFLMPPPVYSHIICPSAVNLFACSFIAGTALLIPFFIKDIIIDRKAIATELFLPERRRALAQAVLRIIFFSWILFPFYYLARVKDPVIILAISYIIFSWRYDTVKTYRITEFLRKNVVIFSASIVFGFLARLWLSPNSLSYPALIRYNILIMVSVSLSTCIHTTLNHFKDYQERIPFAPLLFIGCLLSYTPFLTSLMHAVTQWNVLLYR